MVFKKKKEEQADNTMIDGEDSARHLELVKDVLENTQASIKKALKMINDENVDPAALLEGLQDVKKASAGFTSDDSGNGRIIEGVFNGDKMVGGDGTEHNVPANYASKSKLIEGDILKLTITNNGSFIYKQIGPVERKQIIANLAQDENTGDYFAVKGGTKWKLLTASVTYFHGEAGDEVVILIPKDGTTKWAAVENVIKGGSK